MDESHLVARAQSADPEAWAELIRHYRAFVRVLARRYVGGLDAQDAEQEIWLAVKRKLWQLEHGDRLVPWLRTLCYYQCVNYRKARTRRYLQEVYLPGDAWLRVAECVADPDYRIEDVLERVELRELVARQLDRLPADYGLLLRLRYFDDAGYQEIARTTGLSISTIKWRLHEARRLLKGRLAAAAKRKGAQQ